MSDMKKKAQEGAIIAFRALNQNQTEVDWENRNKNAFALGADDCELIIEDCDLCLRREGLTQTDPRRDQVRDARTYYQALSELVQELAEDESIILA